MIREQRTKENRSRVAYLAGVCAGLALEKNRQKERFEFESNFFLFRNENNGGVERAEKNGMGWKFFFLYDSMILKKKKVGRFFQKDQSERL